LGNLFRLQQDAFSFDLQNIFFGGNRWKDAKTGQKQQELMFFKNITRWQEMRC